MTFVIDPLYPVVFSHHIDKLLCYPKEHTVIHNGQNVGLKCLHLLIVFYE